MLSDDDLIFVHADHFEIGQFINNTRKKLVWNAVPSVFLVPNPPKPLASKRPAPKRRNPLPPPKKKKVTAEAAELTSNAEHTGTKRFHCQDMKNLEFTRKPIIFVFC